MGGKTDFFELPLGDQHHKECIEIEHSDEYRRGVDAGIESFRPRFEAFKKSLQEHYDEKLKEFQKEKRCDECQYFQIVQGNKYVHRCSLLKEERIANNFFCAWHEPKES